MLFNLYITFENSNSKKDKNGKKSFGKKNAGKRGARRRRRNGSRRSKFDKLIGNVKI